ncbi:MAG: hydroxyacid dehydrogenase [Conexivisphaerales archaeon]
MKVFIPEVEEPESLKKIQELAEVKVGIKGKTYSEQDLIKEIADVDVIVITSQFRLTKNIIDHAPNLKGIVKYGSKPGLDNVDLAAANARRIPVAYTPGANADSVAEFTVMLILMLAKKIPSIISNVRDQLWRQKAELGLELLGKTVGIFGLGTIGLKVAQKLSGFGVKIISTDPYISAERVASLGIKLVSLDTLLRESDIVTLHANLTEETKHIIGKRELSLMKPGAYLVNTARGELVDEKALYDALRNGKLAGAALDVFEKEPPSTTNPLLELNNVILTPHVASWTIEALKKEATMAMDEVVRIISGKMPINLANPEAFQTGV